MEDGPSTWSDHPRFGALAQPHGCCPIEHGGLAKTWLLPNRPGALAQRRAIMVTRYGCVGLSA